MRDGLLDALGTDMAPESAVNKEFWWANKRQKQEDEGANSGLDTYGTLRDNVDKLRAFAALDPGPIVRPRRETPLTSGPHAERWCHCSLPWPPGARSPGARLPSPLGNSS